MRVIPHTGCVCDRCMINYFNEGLIEEGTQAYEDVMEIKKRTVYQTDCKQGEVNVNKGFFSLEGPDGVGKTTIMKLVQTLLETKGFVVTITREPGGTPFAEKIRELIFLEDELTNETETLLFAAARQEHFHKKIAPALKRGEIVLCDRYIHSTYIYQGLMKNNLSFVKSLHELCGGDELEPERTFFLDVSPGVAKERLMGRAEKNRFDDKDQSKLGIAYNAIAVTYRNIERINADSDAEIVALYIAEKIEKIIERGNK